jgi:hypothetical protein
MPSVFSGNDIAFAEDAERAEGNVLEVAYGSGNEIERSGKERGPLSEPRREGRRGGRRGIRHGAICGKREGGFQPKTGLANGYTRRLLSPLIFGTRLLLPARIVREADGSVER